MEPITMKTLHERVTEALNAYEFNDSGNGINELIAYAYYLGRCTAAKEACDKAAAIFAEQIARAQTVRYKHLAMKIQGDVRMIYHPDYDQWISLFASDKTDLL